MTENKKLQQVAVVVAWMVCGSTNVAIGDADFLPSLQKQFSNLQTVHLEARFYIDKTDVPNGPLGGFGTFEYWAAGNYYRTTCKAPPNMQLLGDMDIAFDGDLFQFLMLETSTLSVQRDQPEFLPTAVPNPFFLPLSFITDNVYSLRLPDLAPTGFWQSPAAKRMKSADAAVGPDAGVRAYRTTGLRPLEEEVEYRITLNSSGDIEQLETFSLRGELQSVMDFMEYEFVEGTRLRFPRKINVHDYLPEEPEEPVMGLRFVIRALEVNQEIDPEVFTIERDDVDAIWDSDKKEYLKYLAFY